MHVQAAISYMFTLVRSRTEAAGRRLGVVCRCGDVIVVSLMRVVVGSGTRVRGVQVRACGVTVHVCVVTDNDLCGEGRGRAGACLCGGVQP